ncbi:MAG: hypothetical protein H0T18_04915 [Chloroflexia bacterium]|nr:hypothetical protein [Chloroflexia bacterium]
MDSPPCQETEERPLPFVLRVAAEWTNIEDLPGPNDGVLFFRKRISLTGDLSSTEDGLDVQFSDIGVGS